MSPNRATDAKQKLVQASIELIRRNGYVATTVDEICSQAGVTKGAFFHHFESKEALAETCLNEWGCRISAMHESAPFQTVRDPTDKLFACVDFFIGVFENPKMFKSCLAGTIVQEVSESHPTLREAAQVCFASGERNFKSLLDEVCQQRGIKIDSASLARLWIATIQGSLVLAKASRDDSTIPGNLRHFRRYLQSLLSTR